MATEYIDLSPPPPWMDECPLSNEPFEQSKTSVASGLGLPQAVVGFGRMVALDKFEVQKYRHLITPMVELYRTFRDQMENFQETIIRSVVLVMQPLMLHRTEASLYYDALFTAISANGSSSGNTPHREPPHDIIRIVVRRITARFTQIYDNASGAIKRLEEFEEGMKRLEPVADKLCIDPGKMPTPADDVVDKNASRKKGVSVEDVGSPTDTKVQDIMWLQKDAIMSEINSIIENTRGLIDILQRIQGEMEQSKSKLERLQQRVDDKQPIPAGYLVPERMTLINRWKRLGDVVEKWTKVAYIAKEWT